MKCYNCKQETKKAQISDILCKSCEEEISQDPGIIIFVIATAIMVIMTIYALKEAAIAYFIGVASVIVMILINKKRKENKK